MLNFKTVLLNVQEIHCFEINELIQPDSGSLIAGSECYLIKLFNAFIV